MRSLLLPLSAVAACALPSAATATTYCVNKPSCAAVPGNLTAPTLKSAINLAGANPGQDAIELGAGTFPYPGSVPTVMSNNDISTISGAGQGTTHVVQGASGALEVDRAGTVVQDLTIDTIAGVTSNAFVLQGAGATARRVTVGGAGDDGAAFGLDGGAVLDHVTVAVPRVSGGMTAAYVFGSGGATIADSSFSAAYGIRVNDADTTRLRNVRTASMFTPLEVDAGTLDADGLLVTPPDGNGDLVTIGSGGTATATLRHATLLTRAGTTGIDVNAYAAGGRATAIVRDTVVTGAGTALRRASVGGATASLDIAYSAYDPARTNIVGLPGATDVVLGDPRLGADFAPLAGSPLIDRGELALPAGAAATDLAGAPRVSGGRTDIGAFEVQAPPVPISAPAGSGAPQESTAPPAPAPAPPAVPAPLAGVGRPLGARLVLFASARQRLDKHGRFTVAATCDAPLGCTGTLRLTARSGRRTVTLGSTKVSLRNGAARTFHIRLTRSGRALLRHHSKGLSVAVRASVRDAHGTSLPARTAFSGRRR
jgi:hypothetical protein